MSCQALLKAGGAGTDSRFPHAHDESEYLLERPRLVLAMLDLMEKFERENFGIDREEVNRHAP